MPTGKIEFKCIRINLKRILAFEPDEGHSDSLIEFDLKIGDERLKDLSAEVRQRNGTYFQSQPLEVGNIIGYDGPWNYEEFREFCGRYYRDVIGSSGLGRTINRGERNLIERVRADKKAAAAGKKATKAFYPELLDEDELRPLQEAETAVSERERIDQEAEENHSKTETWHSFMTL